MSVGGLTRGVPISSIRPGSSAVNYTPARFDFTASCARSMIEKP
jgi:hypothetical protein